MEEPGLQNSSSLLQSEDRETFGAILNWKNGAREESCQQRKKGMGMIRGASGGEGVGREGESETL